MTGTTESPCSPSRAKHSRSSHSTRCAHSLGTNTAPSPKRKSGNTKSVSPELISTMIHHRMKQLETDPIAEEEEDKIIGTLYF